MFTGFQINIRNESAYKINGYDEFENLFPNSNFSAKINLIIGEYTAHLEFPINHVSMKPEFRMWQIETGPVLFPVMTKKENFFEYLPSFVHFNNLEKMDIFYDYPFGNRSVNMQGKGVVEDFPCSIELFS